MSTRLSAFLHPVQPAGSKEVYISDRFRGEDGKPVPFKIRALTQEENDDTARKCRRLREVNGQKQEYLDTTQFNRELVVLATVEPDFKSTEVCEAYGTRIPTQVPGKMLLAGEYSRLLRAIMELSGFDAEGAAALEEEAKN